MDIRTVLKSKGFLVRTKKSIYLGCIRRSLETCTGNIVVITSTTFLVGSSLNQKVSSNHERMPEGQGLLSDAHELNRIGDPVFPCVCTRSMDCIKKEECTMHKRDEFPGVIAYDSGEAHSPKRSIS